MTFICPRCGLRVDDANPGDRLQCSNRKTGCWKVNMRLEKTDWFANAMQPEKQEEK